MTGGICSMCGLLSRQLSPAVSSTGCRMMVCQACYFDHVRFVDRKPTGWA